MINKKITAQEGYALIQENQENPDFMILDVRTHVEFQTGHIEGAINFDIYVEDLEGKLSKLNKDKLYLLYCRTGARSAFVFRLMQHLGFEDVFDMGGIFDWIDAGLPIER